MKQLLDIRDFGDALIRTGDLDPVYTAIVGAGLDEPQLCRLLLAYWCFYHLGVAGWMSERKGADYWECMDNAAENRLCTTPFGVGDRWPRMAERRHFRGPKCVQAVGYLSRRFPQPETPVHWLVEVDTDQGVMARVQEWPLFGPWIAFKAADMLERVYRAPIRFSPNIGLIYAEPREALNILSAQAKAGVWVTTDPRPEAIYDNLLRYFQPRRAPPSGDRCCGPQEVETVLCKWKSHVRGHYHVGKDIAEVTHSLQGWGETADRMSVALRRATAETPAPGTPQSAKTGVAVG